MSSELEQRSSGIGLAITRVVVGLLWFSQLFWKLPPTFGCPTPFKFSTREQFTSGLCDWVGREAAYAGTLRVFNLDLHLLGQPNFYIDLSFLSGAYGAFVNGFVIPNFSWMAWVIFGMEFIAAFTLIFGILGRLGALVGLGMAANLTIGLLPIPGEWEWAYIMLTTLNFVLLMTTGNRVLGIDGRLNAWAVAQSAKGNTVAKIVRWLT